MTYIVKGKGKSWELREAMSTPRGPRSQTLATFTELSPDVVKRAGERAKKPIDPIRLEKLARRVGAPVALPEGDRAARKLISAMTRGERPRPIIARFLQAELGGANAEPVSSAVRAAGAWLDASPHDRSDALTDLLLLTDAIPAAKPRGDLCFPRFGHAGS